MQDDHEMDLYGLPVADAKELSQAEDQLMRWYVTSPFLVSTAVEWYRRQIWLSARVVQRLPMGLEGSYISATVAPLLEKAPGPPPPAMPTLTTDNF